MGERLELVEFVNAELTDDASMDAAIKGAKYVIHTASPVVLADAKDPDTVIKPAIEGCLSAVRASAKHRVERVVITSSVMACMHFLPRN